MNIMPVYPHYFTEKIGCAAVTFANFLDKSGLGSTIRKIAYPVFKGTTSSYLSAFGSLELIQGRQKRLTIDPTSCRTELKSSASYMYIHGSLISASGLCGIMETLENLGIATFGSIGSAIFKAGSLFFLGANIIALEENVRLFNAAAEADESNAVKSLLKQSAVSGIISNLGYIIATSILLLGAPAGIALAIGVIGACSGAFKILCDFLLWKNEYDAICLGILDSI